MILNIPAQFLAVLPDDVVARATRTQFGVMTAAWRNSASGSANGGQLTAARANIDAVITCDGTFGFLATTGKLLPASATDVYSATAPIMVEQMVDQSGSNLLNQPTYAPLIFDNAVNASDLGEWPTGIYIPPKGTLMIRVSNLDGAAAINVMISLWGYRIFPG